MKELSTLETAYDKGLLEKESELINLAQALLAQEVPYKAARIVAKGLKDKTIEPSARNLSLLGDAWMLAKEYDKAIVVMAKAAKASGEGDDYFKLAQIHTERQEWKQALSNVNQALKDDELKNVHSARILKGLVMFNMDNLDGAEKVFAAIKAADSDDKVANQWLTYIQGEKQRRAYMAEVR
jgi:tetratricopeptide (TPR) repeat protein